MAEKLSDKVFASAEDAIAHGGEKDPILEHRNWVHVEKVFVVIHLFQGIIHEVKVHTDQKIAKADYEGRIIAAYGELVDEQYGKDEILLEEAQVEP